MADIRRSATTQVGLKREWLKSLGSIIQLLNDRFERLSLKGKPFYAEECAEDHEIEMMSKLIHKVDPSVDLSRLQQNYTTTIF